MLNKKILEGLFRQHYSEMFHLARTLLGADEEAEDIVQDVFARLMETDIIPEAEGIRAYLMTAVHHGCTNFIRRTSMRQQLEAKYMGIGVGRLPLNTRLMYFDLLKIKVNEE